VNKIICTTIILLLSLTKSIIALDNNQQQLRNLLQEYEETARELVVLTARYDLLAPDTVEALQLSKLGMYFCNLEESILHELRLKMREASPKDKAEFSALVVEKVQAASVYERALFADFLRILVSEMPHEKGERSTLAVLGEQALATQLEDPGFDQYVSKHVKEPLLFERDTGRLSPFPRTKGGNFRIQSDSKFKKGELALTFDDGPATEGTTLSILETLRSAGAKATFFQLGSRLASPDAEALSRRILLDGHVIAVHGYWHATRDGKPFTVLDSQSIKNDLDRVRKIQMSLGASPKLFRAPYGEFRYSDDDVLSELSLHYVGWNIDTNDWRKKTVGKLVDDTIDGMRRHGKGIILMHDIKERTALALPAILQWVDDSGYTVVDLTDVLDR